MAIQRELFSAPSSSSLRLMASTGGSGSKKGSSKARVSSSKNSCFGSRTLGSKSHNGHLPISDGSGRSQVGVEEQDGGSVSPLDQPSVEPIDYFDICGEGSLCDDDKAVANIEIDKDSQANDCMEMPVTTTTNSRNGDQASTIISTIASRNKPNQSTSLTRQNEGDQDICRLKPELENFVFLKALADFDEDGNRSIPGSDILEKETGVDAKMHRNDHLQHHVPISSGVDSQSNRAQKKLVRLAISLLASDTEAAALVIDEGLHETKELSFITAEEADILETAFQILRSELRTYNRSTERAAGSKVTSTKIWYFLAAVLLLRSLWNVWYVVLQQEWVAAVPT